MSAVSVVPAAVRLPRTVAARRALLAGLFLIGFVAIGFAFGHGAHADDRTQHLTGAITPAKLTESAEGAASADDAASAEGAASPDKPSPEGRATPAHRASAPTVEAPAEATAPVRAATRAGAPVRHSRSGAALERQGAAAGKAAAGEIADVVRPAAEQAARVTEPLTGAVREVGGAAGAVLPLPCPPGTHPGAPGDGGRPQDGSAPHGGAPAGVHHTAGSDAAGTARSGAAGTRAPAAEQARSAVHEQGTPGRDGLPGPLPEAPVAPASQSAGAGHGPRGDQHAVLPADITLVGLLPGGVRTADGAPTRHRAEDIIEFPG
ncbi:hypothetical protein ACIBK8_17425 [Streptomyces sp. NPDC050161]|uniref:hypothetical protein n=1 Tax=Streptomyces sp. NPDC050161 TaxID=3365604 RepID=UPI003798D472